MVLDDIKDDVSQIQEDTKAYVETTVEYFKLRGFKMVAKSATVLLKLLLVTITALMMLIFASIAGAVAIGEAIESPTLGFLIVAGIYFVLFVLFVMLKPRRIEKSVLRRFSDIIFNDKH